MNAIYGKTSVGFFIAFWLWIGLYPPADFLAFSLLPLFLISGVICAYMGKKKKETPPDYAIVGFWNNLGLLVLMLLGILSCAE